MQWHNDRRQQSVPRPQTTNNDDETAKGLSIIFNDGGDTAGIDAISTTTTAANGAIYNLHGQRVSTPIRGNIYIQNGRKFIAK